MPAIKPGLPSSSPQPTPSPASGLLQKAIGRFSSAGSCVTVDNRASPNTEAFQSMDPTHIQALQQLRSWVPVGLRHAQVLLEQCAGDPQQAAERFKAELLQHLVTQSGLPLEQARDCLQHADYDLPRALAAIEEARFTLTQRILRKHHRDPGHAVSLIAQAVETVHQLHRAYWLALEQLDALAPALRCFMTLYEWASYEDWEGFDSAVHFQLAPTIAQFRYLQWLELADALEQPDLRLGREAYQRHKPQLDEALLNLAQENIPLFPQ